MSTPRRGWCRCCVDIGIAERYWKVMESHRSQLSRLRLCWHELDLQESSVEEHATNGVAESSIREVKRQMRSLIALEALVAKTVVCHPILKWIPTMASDAISFFRIGKGGLTAEMRRSGRAWKNVAEYEESVHQRWQEQLQSGCNQSCMLDGSLGADEVVKAAGLRRMNEESRWNVDSWHALRDLPLGCHRKGSRSCRGCSSPTTSNHPSAFGATSALRHEGRLEKVLV